MGEKYLFRGKRLDNDEWEVGNYGYVTPDESHVIYTYETVPGFVYVNPDTVGQCTGLKDMDGMLLFEGDIVKNTKGFVGVYKVIWSVDYYRIKLIQIDGNRILEPGKDFMQYEIELVGNVHDNPELL